MTDTINEIEVQPQLRNMTVSDLMDRLNETVAELRQRDQIAFTYWTREDMDHWFDQAAKSYDPVALEPHRHAFRQFALRRIGYFLGHDGNFNNRVRRELRAWLKKNRGIAAKPPKEDDTREFFESLARPADQED